MFIKICIIVYIISFVICILGYTKRTIDNMLEDYKQRDINFSFKQHKKDLKVGLLNEETFKDLYPDYEWSYFYTPTDSYGDLIGRFFLSIIPIINIYVAIVDIIPELYDYCTILQKFFDSPIIPPVKDEEDEFKFEVLS